MSSRAQVEIPTPVDAAILRSLLATVAAVAEFVTVEANYGTIVVKLSGLRPAAPIEPIVIHDQVSVAIQPPPPAPVELRQVVAELEDEPHRVDEPEDEQPAPTFEVFAPRSLRDQILDNLRRRGPAVHPNGRAAGVLADRVEVAAGGYFAQLLRELDSEGLIRREVNGRRTLRIEAADGTEVLEELEEADLPELSSAERRQRARDAAAAAL